MLKKRRLWRYFAVASVLSLALWGLPASGEDADDYAGDEACAACHEEIVTSFARTGHARSAGWGDTHGCESCHGSAVAHIEGGGDLDAIAVLSRLSSHESSATCLDCHQNQAAHFNSVRSIHSLADVGCIDCHNPHEPSVGQLRGEGPALCENCHQAIVAQFELPRSHPLADDAGCIDCHSPHAARSLRSDPTLFGSTCTNCHFEKAGPFLFNHDVALVDGCASCHEVHGSPNRHLLKHETQVNLCYQCHNASVTPTWHSAPRFLNEKCTACHTAIHGSNTTPYFLEE